MTLTSLFRRTLFPLVALALVLGAVLRVLAGPEPAELVWSAATAVVAANLVAVTVARLREGRIAVDLIALVALGAAVALDEPLAGVILALMVASGDALERYAHGRAQRSLAALLALAPKVAHRRVDSGYEDLPVDRVGPGDVLLVKPGEVVPVDGTALDPAVLDTSVLTGEAQPVERAAGTAVQSGAVNAGGAFHLRATASAGDSAYAGIVRLVRSAGVGRAPFVRLADRYALWFVPVVFALAAGAWLATGEVARALAVLVIATPCPLVLAAPVAIVAGIASSARVGVVVKDGGALEAMAQTRTVLFDKTGTLTAGRARVLAVIAGPGRDPGEVLALAASVEQASPHVLAGVIVDEARSRGLDVRKPTRVEEQPGAGVAGTVDGRRVWVGAARPEGPGPYPPAWVQAAQRRARREGGNTISVVVDDEPAAVILFSDEVRTDAPRALRALRRAGVERFVMVTGDREAVAAPIAASIGIDQVYAERSPEEKLEIVRQESAGRTGTTVMVGDGVNDAPALAAADLGVAMGARGATASSEAADVVLVVDRLDRLATAVAIAGRARGIARQSVLLGMGLSFVGMGFAAAGLIGPVAGAVAQEVIDVLAITNALRALRPPREARVRGEVPSTWGHQLDAGHGPLLLLLEEARATAGALEGADPEQARRSLAAISDRITSEIVPHERTDETLVYPDVAAQLGGEDPLGTMSRTHQEIFHLAGLLHRLAVEAPPGQFDDDDRSEGRRLLYALDAILRLHFAQEEELLLGMTSRARP